MPFSLIIYCSRLCIAPLPLSAPPRRGGDQYPPVGGYWTLCDSSTPPTGGYWSLCEYPPRRGGGTSTPPVGGVLEWSPPLWGGGLVRSKNGTMIVLRTNGGWLFVGLAKACLRGGPANPKRSSSASRWDGAGPLRGSLRDPSRSPPPMGGGPGRGLTPAGRGPYRAPPPMGGGPGRGLTPAGRGPYRYLSGDPRGTVPKAPSVRLARQLQRPQRQRLLAIPTSCARVAEHNQDLRCVITPDEQHVV